MKKILVSEEELKRIIFPLQNRADSLSISKEDILNLFHIVEVERNPEDEFIDDIAYVLKKHKALFILDSSRCTIIRILSPKFKETITHMFKFVKAVNSKSMGISDET